MRKFRFIPSKEELINLYEYKQYSARDIAAIYNCSFPTVIAWLNYYEMPTRSRKDSASLSHSQGKGVKYGGKSHLYKNNTKILKGGYVGILNREHPYCNSQGYVPEHRLIMEQFLGRYLDPKEIVHHKNGLKTDNRIDSLELMDSNSDHIKLENRYRTRNKKGQYTRATLKSNLE